MISQKFKVLLSLTSILCWDNLGVVSLLFHLLLLLLILTFQSSPYQGWPVCTSNMIPANDTPVLNAPSYGPPSREQTSRLLFALLVTHLPPSSSLQAVFSASNFFLVYKMTLSSVTLLDPLLQFTTRHWPCNERTRVSDTCSY